jgi:hypothetical protein
MKVEPDDLRRWGYDELTKIIDEHVATMPDRPKIVLTIMFGGGNPTKQMPKHCARWLRSIFRHKRYFGLGNLFESFTSDSIPRNEQHFIISGESQLRCLAWMRWPSTSTVRLNSVWTGFFTMPLQMIPFLRHIGRVSRSNDDH